MWRLASPGTLELSSGHLFPGMTFTAQGKGVSHLVSSDHIFLTPDRYSESGGRKNIYWAVCMCVCVCLCVLEGWTIHAITLGCQARGPQPLLPSSDMRGLCGVAGVPAGLRDMDSQFPRAVSPFLAKETADVSKLKMWQGGDDSGLPVRAQCADGGACDRGSRARVNRR